MTASASRTDGPLAERPAGDRLDSWKDIAAYLKRNVSTVQRWERHEGLPVRRHFHKKLGSVYAYRSDIDEWWQRRARHIDATSGHHDDDRPASSEPAAEGALQMKGWRMPAAALRSTEARLRPEWPEQQ